MNFKITQRAALLLFIFVSSGSFAQYKYDIGLKVSSHDMERFQLEQRFHFDNPYSLVVTIASGSKGSGNYTESPYYNDSLFDLTSNFHNVNNTVLKVGVQRKLGFLATDVFYVGATIGMGYEQQRTNLRTTTYSIGASMPTNPPNHYMWEEISSIHEQNRTNAINAQIGASFGMDVPISKRFSINAEVAFSGMYERSIETSYPYTYITLLGSVSGGLRYQFGKRE
jgi:hypothetical protein